MNVRPIDPGDLAAIAAIAGADEAALHGWDERRVGVVDVRTWLARIDLGRDSWALEEEGRIVGGGWLSLSGTDATITGVVAQGRKGRGYGDALLDLSEARARERGATKLQAFAFEVDTAAAELFARRGYSVVRSFYEMSIELVGAAGPCRIFRPGLVLDAVGEDECRAFYEAIDEAFQDHWEWHSMPVRGVAGSCGAASTPTATRRSVARRPRRRMRSPRSAATRPGRNGGGLGRHDRCSPRRGAAAASPGRSCVHTFSASFTAAASDRVGARRRRGEPDGRHEALRERRHGRSSSCKLVYEKMQSMSLLRAKCPTCHGYTAVAIDDGYECHACGRTFAAGLVRVPRAWGDGGEAMVESAALPLDYPEVAVVEEETLAAQTLAVASDLPARPLVLGGCCCSHIGAVEGLAARHGRLGVIWLDAHGDLNTPESSPSGNEWGMPLRMLIDGGAVDAARRRALGRPQPRPARGRSSSPRPASTAEPERGARRASTTSTSRSTATSSTRRDRGLHARAGRPALAERRAAPDRHPRARRARRRRAHRARARTRRTSSARTAHRRRSASRPGSPSATVSPQSDGSKLLDRGQDRRLDRDQRQAGAAAEAPEHLPELSVALPRRRARGVAAGSAASAGTTFPCARAPGSPRSPTRARSPRRPPSSTRTDPLGFFDLRPYTERLAEAEMSTGLARRDGDRPRGDRAAAAASSRSWTSRSWAARWAASSARSSRAPATRPASGRRAARRRHELGRRAHAGGDPLADAAAEDGLRGRGSAATPGSAMIVVMAHPTTGRRARQLRDARRRLARGARRADRVHRAARRQQTTREKLPDDFGLAEQNLRFGHLDAIVPRPELRSTARAAPEALRCPRVSTSCGCASGSSRLRKLPLLGGAKLSGELERLQRQIDRIQAEPVTDEDVWRTVELARHDDAAVHARLRRAAARRLVRAARRPRVWPTTARWSPGSASSTAGPSRSSASRRGATSRSGRGASSGCRTRRATEGDARDGDSPTATASRSISLVDTPGAYPGVAAEQHGQGGAIAAVAGGDGRLDGADRRLRDRRGRLGRGDRDRARATGC